MSRTTRRTTLSRGGAPPQDRVGAFGRLAEHGIGEVSVHVGCGRDACVTEDPRHDGEFLALLESERCAGVPKVVEALSGQAGRRE